MAKTVFFGRSDGGEDNLKKGFFNSIQGRYGHQVHVESTPVWIVCVDLEIFSSEPGAPKWYFEELYFLN
jgi:hypothetical protein